MVSNILGRITKDDVEKLVAEDASHSAVVYGLPYLLQSLRSDNLNNHKLAEVIARFPHVAARLLSVANSPWAASCIPIESLHMACARLGLDLVRSISIAACICSTFNPRSCMSFDVRYYWNTALLVADGAELLGSCLPNPTILDEKTLYTAGLVHNIGLLWLAEKTPILTSQALETISTDRKISSLEALRVTVGTDYCEVGGELGRAWSLPTSLITIMEQHGNPGYTGPDFQSALLVGYVAKMVSTLLRGIGDRPVITEIKGLTIDSSDLDEIYSKLADKLGEYVELSQTLFPVS